MRQRTTFYVDSDQVDELRRLKGDNFNLSEWLRGAISEAVDVEIAIPIPEITHWGDKEEDLKEEQEEEAWEVEEEDERIPKSDPLDDIMDFFRKSQEEE